MVRQWKMTHRNALKLQLAAFEVTDMAAAEVQLAFGLADLLDEMPDVDVYREYRFALKHLREVLGGDITIDQNISGLLERLGRADARDTADAG